MVGAWISHDRERNEREIEALIRLAKDGQVDIAVVGNEVLLRGELPEPELLAYIARVKAAVPDDVPVGCVDAYYQFLERPALTAACDVLLPNCYPFWEGADIDVAAQYVRRMHGLVKAAGGETSRVIVAETGWPGKGQPVAERRADRPTTRCATSSTSSNGPGGEGIKLFYFSSFDEPWKLGAGRRSGHAVGPVGQGRAAQIWRVGSRRRHFETFEPTRENRQRGPPMAAASASSHIAPNTKGSAFGAQRPRRARCTSGASGHRSASPERSYSSRTWSVARSAVKTPTLITAATAIPNSGKAKPIQLVALVPSVT